MVTSRDGGEGATSDLQPAVIVTGAAQGIGAAIARRLAGPAITTVCVDVNADGLEDTTEEVAKIGPVTTFLCDVGDPQQIDAMWSEIDAMGLTPTVCVCNAGIFPRLAALEMSPDTFWRCMHVNVGGTFFTAQGAAARMRTRGGSIVAVASGIGIRPTPLSAAYAASKAAIINVTRVLAREWGPLGIRVNCVGPGLTPTAQPLAARSIEELEAAAADFPIARLARPEDCANVVAFLASDDATYMTGQYVTADGGLSLV